MRQVAAVSVLLFLSAILAAAQGPPSGNFFVGYSYANADVGALNRANVNGWQATLEGRVFPHVGIVADFTGHYGSQDFAAFCEVAPCPINFVNLSLSEHNVMFGPRFSASVGKLRPFFEAEVGVSHLTVNSAGSHNSFATSVGGGIDYRLMRFVAWRFQGDYVATRFFSTTQNNIRLSTGIVFRF